MSNLYIKEFKIFLKGKTYNITEVKENYYKIQIDDSHTLYFSAFDFSYNICKLYTKCKNEKIKFYDKEKYFKKYDSLINSISYEIEELKLKEKI